MPETIDSLQLEIGARAQEAIQSLDRLSSSLVHLKASVRGGSGLTTTANQVKRLGMALSGIGDPSSKILELVKGLKPLQNIEKSNLNSTLNSLKKLPQITKELASVDMGAFENQIKRVTRALKPLADEMNKVAMGFQAFPSRIQKAIQQNERLSGSTRRAGRSFGVMGTGISQGVFQLGLWGLGVQSVSGAIKDWIAKGNDYVENVNLFTVAMGKYANAAMEYAKTVNEAMGIDISEWIRNQGIFMQIATGFGVVEEKAYKMSQGLTQIAYDISSFFNISVQEALFKVQSGISGELEPLRRLGYALDVATLGHVAMEHGISQSVNTMTQAQKAQLRYVAIMEQSGNVMGDMSRTILTPANAMRILEQQVVQLRRALGNLLLPILMKIIPYVMAFVKALTSAINVLATFFGWELPKIDYSGVQDMGASVEALGDSADDAKGKLGGAADAAKRLKNATLGFDELNVISKDEPKKASGGGRGGSAGAGLGGDLGLPIETYDFLGKLQGQADILTDKLKTAFKDVLTLALSIGTAMKAWKIAPKLYDALHDEDGKRKIFDKEKRQVRKEKAMEGWRGKLGKVGEVIPVVPLPTLKGLMDFLKKLKGKQKFVVGLTAGTLAVVGHFGNLILKSKNFRKGLAEIGKVFGKVFGYFKEHGIIGGFLDMLAKLGDLLVKLMPKFSPFTAVLKFIVDVIKNLKNVLEPVLSLFDGFGTDIGMIVAGLATISNPIGWTILGLEALSVAIRGIGAATSDVIEPVEVLTDEISDLTRQKLKPILDDFEGLDKKIQDISFGDKIITNEDISEVATKVKTLSDTIVKDLDSKHNQALADLKPLENTLDPAVYKKMIDEVNKSHDDRVKKVKETQDEIQKILKKAQSENRALNKDEVDRIKKHEETLKNIMVNTMASTEEEIKLISERIGNNQSAQALKSADEVIKKARETREERIKNAEAVYQNTLDIAGRSNLSLEEYEKVRKKASDTRSHEISEAIVAYTQISEKVKTSLGEDAKHYDFLEGHIKSKWDTIVEYSSNAWGAFTKAMSNEWDDFTKWLGDGLDGVERSLSETFEGMKSSVETNFNNLNTLVSNAWGRIKVKTSEKLENLKTLTTQKYEETRFKLETAYETWEKLASETWENIKKKTFEKIGHIRDNIKPRLDEIKGKMKTWADEKIRLIEDTWLGKSGVWAGIKKGVKHIAENLPGALSAIGNAWSNFWGGLSDVVRGILNSAIGYLESGINRLIGGINSAIDKIPKKFRDVAGVGKVGQIHINRFATGGFVDEGQLFIAREAGAELVGSMGNRTTVANNQQIVEGISHGVSIANAEQNALLKEQNSLLRQLLEKGTNISLDGKVLAKTVEQVQRDRGFAIIG